MVHRWLTGGVQHKTLVTLTLPVWRDPGIARPDRTSSGLTKVRRLSHLVALKKNKE
jgi:hypothetical protein